LIVPNVISGEFGLDGYFPELRNGLREVDPWKLITYLGVLGGLALILLELKRMMNGIQDLLRAVFRSGIV
jgi:hypothetical protein